MILGTVQFGLAYGVAGRGEPVPEGEVREILEVATAHGVRVLDTAPGYGDIEQRLAPLCADLELAVISKIPPAPEANAGDAVRSSVERSRERLGDRLDTLLFHRADDLLRSDADEIWRTATDAASGVKVGVSCYDPASAVELRRRFGISVAQLPANAFDQRLRDEGVSEALADVDIHARSALLQGLLAMHSDAVSTRVPKAAEPHRRWTAWCNAHGLDPVAAAFAIARGLPRVRSCVVGVDSVAQLREVLQADATAQFIDAPELRCDDLDVIDPRRWTVA